MASFIAYFHVQETRGIHRSLGHIHDTFKRLLPDDMTIFVGWDEDRGSEVKYTARIESKFDDNDRIRQAFRNISESFDPYIRLSTLLHQCNIRKAKLIDIFEAVTI